jgi:leader peptidase (prepilin peptidase)/N-methyltransferase
MTDSIELAVRIYLIVISFIFGAVFGSFINCMAWRIVHHENVMKGRSHCAVCGHPLGAADLVPIFSYLFLKGRCRYCGKKIAPRYMITELILAVSFALIAGQYGLQFATLRYLVLAAILLGAALVDLDSYLIPDGFIIAGIIWWGICFVLALLFPFLSDGGTVSFSGDPGAVLQKLFCIPAAFPDGQTQLLQGITGAAAISLFLFLLSLLFDHMTGKESLGGGDIKLFFMVSLFLGPWVGLFNMILSCIIGLLFSAALKRSRIPFGPSIAISTVISVIIGANVVKFYVSLF